MQMVPVESSMISAVGYETKTREMQVVFNSGRVYRSRDVNEDEYEGLLQAESKGRYMNDNIIGVYDDDRID